MAKKRWYESDSAERQALGFGGIAAIAVGIVLLLTAGVWIFTVVTSDVKGQGDATKIVNDGQNRLQSETEFSQRYEAILRYDKDINVAAEALRDAQGREEEDLDFYRENMDGGVRNCNTSVAEYNALAANAQKAKYRPADKPERVDPSNPDTDCKPSDFATAPAPSGGQTPTTGGGVPSPAPTTSN